MAIKLMPGGSPCTQGIYEVSTTGQIRRTKNGKILTPKIERNGYVRVHLSKNGIAESVSLHRIVAKAFVPNPKGYKTVNHINEDKSDNRVENLEWASMSYQNSYGKGAINRNLAKQVPVLQFDMSGRLLRKWDSIKEVAETYGLNPSSIVAVCKKKKRYKSTGGYKFAYLEEAHQ